MMTAQEIQQQCKDAWTKAYNSALEHGYNKDEATEIATNKEITFRIKSNFWSNRMADGSHVCRRCAGYRCGGYNCGLPEAHHSECEELSVVEKQRAQFLRKEYPEFSDKTDLEIIEIWEEQMKKKSKEKQA